MLIRDPSFSITHGPTADELVFMKGWIRDLVAFVNDEKEYKYGTAEIDDYKVATPEAKIEIQKDTRWKELLDLAKIFNSE